ncbi:MAG: DNRLRE domain-containing protein [Gammaproteobacteria bacterium]
MNRRNQSGIALVAVLVFLLVIAAVVALRGGEELGEIHLASADMEVRRLDYAAAAGMQHARWQARNASCMGDFTIAETAIGPDKYSAASTGGGSNTVYSVVPDQDAWIRSDNPTNTGAGRQHIRSEGPVLERALFRFDLATLPSAAQVRSAVAWFYLEPGKEHPQGPIDVHRITADWTEDGATWADVNDKFDAARLAMIPAQPTGGVWVSINLTAQVQAWVNGQPNHGIMFLSTAEGLYAEYQGRESGGTSPRLEVVVGTGAASPLNVTATGTLANGKTRTLNQPVTPAYQPPGTVTLQLGTDPGEDAMPDSFYSARNYGGATYVQINDNGSDWRQYPLIRFALAGVPPGAYVRSAQLELHLDDIRTSGAATVHRVTRDWVEGTKSGTGTADGSTWFTHDGSNAWASPGGDFEAGAVAETTIAGTETWVSWDIAALVQRWLDGEPNYGLMLRPAGGLQEAEFSSKEDTTAGVQPKLTITYACECGTTCLAPRGSGTILMAVINPTTLVPADELKKNLFESWGYTVEIISESANQSTYDTAMAGADVVFISETVNATQLGTKLQNAPIGVVSQDGSYNDDLGFATSSAWPVDAAIEIADTDHYVTRPFAAGPLDIYAADMELLTVSGSPAPDARLLGTAGGAGALVTLDAGALGSGGTPVPARRVMLPLGRDSNLSWDYLNSSGLLLVQRAIAWAMGAGDSSATNVLLVVGDPANLTAQEDAKRALMESWDFIVNLIDESDSQANFDAALASNDVVFVTEGSDPGAIGSKLTDTTVGVVNEEEALLVELGFTGDTDSNSRSEIVILENTHYITSGLALGTTTITTSNQPLSFTNNGSAPGAQILAETNQVSSFFEPSLLTLDTNADLFGGGFAAGRRVALPWGAAGFDINALNADGLMIMRRALEWGAGLDPGTSGPLAHWKLDETTGLNAVDSIGGHNGTLTNGPSWTSGQLDGGLSFDGSNDYINVPHDDTLLLTQGMTFTAWSNTLDNGGGYQAIISKDTPANGASNYWFGIENDELVFGFWAEGSFRSVKTATANLASNTFYHLAASFDNATDEVRLYVDGTEVQTGSITFEPTTETADLMIGGSIDAEYWNGVLDDVRMYDRVLTLSDIAELATPPPAPTKLLMVVGSPSSLTAQDAGRLTEFAGWGYDVTVFDDSEAQSAFDAAVASHDVAFVTNSVGGGTLANKLTGAAIPIVDEFPGKLDNFGFSSGTTDTFSANSFNKSDPAHYISSPYGGGSISLLSSFMSMGKPSGTLAPDLQIIGEFATAEFALVALDAGATRYDGNPAAARRVFLPFGPATTAQMTTEALDLMKRSLEWAGGEGGGGGGGPTGVVFQEFTEAKATAATNLSVDKPAGTGTGDLLIATLVTDGSKSASMSAPAGWTVIDLAEQSGQVTYGVWWKLAGASEPASYTWSWSDGEKVYGTVMRFTGHNPATPIDVTATAGGSSSAPSSPAVTTTVADAMILRLGGFDDDDITVDAPGLSGHTAITMDKSSQGNGTSSSGAGYVMQAVAGNSGTSAFALSASEEFRTVTIAIAPIP